MFRGKINPKQPPARKARAVAKQQVNKQRDERQEQKRRRKQLQVLKKTAAKLQSMGVEYSVDLPTIEKEILERKARLKGKFKTSGSLLAYLKYYTAYPQMIEHIVTL